MMIRYTVITLFVALFFPIGCATAHSATAEDKAVSGEVVYTTTPETLKGYLCRPSGQGPFPAVL